MSAPQEPSFAPFTSRRGRLVAFLTAAATIAVMTFVALVAPSPAPGVPRGWHVYDRAVVIAFGVAAGLVLSRFGTVHAVPSADGLVVRNLGASRRVTWPEVLSVQFGPDRPWVQLVLTDTDTLPVMAIQKADGPRAQEEARRLATLVRRYGTGGEPSR